MNDRDVLYVIHAALKPLMKLLDEQLAVVDPNPPPPPPPPDPVTPPPQVTQRFMDLVAIRPQLELADILWRLGRAMTPEELAYARAHNVPGSQPVASGGGGTSAPEQNDLDPASPRYVTMREPSRTFHFPAMPGNSGHWEFEIAPAVGAATIHRVTMQGGRTVETSSGFLTIRSDSDGAYYPPNFRWPFPVVIEAFDAGHQPVQTNLHVRLIHRVN